MTEDFSHSRQNEHIDNMHRGLDKPSPGCVCLACQTTRKILTMNPGIQCKGSWSLGTACGTCLKCADTAPAEIARLKQPRKVVVDDPGNERQYAALVADHWLEGRMNSLTQMVPGDPDCDAAVLARQFMRALETIDHMQKCLRLYQQAADMLSTGLTQARANADRDVWPKSNPIE